jgi:hypothetical protein
MKPISFLLLQLVLATPSVAQIDEAAREAMEQGQYVHAISLLSEALAERPTPDVYLSLGIAYGKMREYQKAQDVLNEGSSRYSDDPRFPNELAKLFLENNDTPSAKSELRRALSKDPDNAFASDMLATIDMSEGDVMAALKEWNRSGRPIVNELLHNYNSGFGSWIVPTATAIHPGEALRYGAWKTTEARLFETSNFSNVALEIEPTRVADRYNTVIRTSAKTNTVADFLFNALKGTPIATAYMDIWNIGNTGTNFNGNYRWDTDRRRAEGRVKMGLPIPGLVHLEFGDTWRSERWDVSKVIRPEYQSRARFDYKANAMDVRLKHIVHYRLEVGGGFEYRNRAAKGDLPELSTDSGNTGKFSVDASVRLADRRYQNRVRVEAFAARPNIIGDAHFTGGVAELNNRVTLSKESGTHFNWTVKGGTARGRLPVEDYFVLGLDTRAINPLRGHTAADHGRYGRGPMGTDFVLANSDITRHLRTIPLFNTLNIPFISASWELFFDAGKTWDRNRIFLPSKLLLDTGTGIRLETPTHAFHLIYGRSLREGKDILFGYYERRLW